MVIAVPVLSVLTSCSTVKAKPDFDNSEILKGFIEEMPELPALPSLNWTYRDGLYCLSEADVDKLLNYGENDIPSYKYQMDLWKAKLDVILSYL